MKSKIAVATALALALVLTGCAPSAGNQRGEGGSSTYYRDADATLIFVPLGDGTTVRCIDANRGLSCDWEGVR